jgi:hypothetical protein
MARKGVLPKEVKLQPFMKDGRTPRCQFVRKVGIQCAKAAMSPRPNCQSHGGKAGRPPTTGEHSKYNPVPRALQEKFEKSLNDPELLDLSNKVALLDAQIWQLCEEASSQENFDEKQIRQLLTLMKNHKDLVAQETQRQIGLGNMLDTKQVMQIIGYVYSLVSRHVSDPTARNNIGAGLRALVQSPIESTDASKAIISVE